MIPITPTIKASLEGLGPNQNPFSRLDKNQEILRKYNASLDKIGDNNPSSMANDIKYGNKNLDHSQIKDANELGTETSNEILKKESVLDNHSEINPNASLDKVVNESTEQGSANTYYCPIEGSNGHWEGQRGDSGWVPDSEAVPAKNNPEGKTWRDVSHEYGIERINFKDGEPDFSEVSKGEVILDEKETDRAVVFNESDIKLAEQRGCTPEEVRAWRKEHGYTWHEKSDGLTTQKVPSIIHGNISHAGGHSVNVNSL